MNKARFFSRTARLPWIMALSVLCGHSAHGEDATLAALDLADKTEFSPVTSKKLTMSAEAATSLNEQRDNRQRISIDLRWDAPLTESPSQDWRFVLANRFDSYFSPALRNDSNINSLKEAYLTYKVTPRLLLDAGRVNTRYGLAFGYNPTDFLGQGTVRSVTSVDPETLRNNRLGNAMLRWQYVWDKGALTAIWSPKLNENPNQNSASLDWGASNPRQRMLLVGSYQWADNLNPQWLFLQEQGHSPQLGFNFSRVLSHSTLFYTEWAGGRQAYRWQTSLPEQQQEIRWRNRLAYGLTWSGENQLTLRAEGHYNGSADNRRALGFVSSLPPDAMAQGKAFIGNASQQAQTGLMPRRAVLFQAYWKDIVDDYDVNAIWQHDLQQRRNMGFAELRRHIGPVDLALQWQKIYLVEPSIKEEWVRPERRWQLSLNYYF
ncbi:hypothetical protein Z042_11910 [Chania multitudinisentens RB-25]|uniref:Porin n=1 Tax=Chania multitudinisentens RB-25 TaxID=1441930 RepID=W0LL80_9GAMM|nr:hypothetical protein [Chania multitudinisentens]AHG22765.1 hypothetical protein Z042_11910 [Chania multitudinisentens RB-25]